MRLILKFNPQTNIDYNEINKHDIQGFIYSLLKDTLFDSYHDLVGFKYFTYSNIFPVTDFNVNEVKTLIVSSPSSAFIKMIYNSLKQLDSFRLNKYYMNIVSVKFFKLSCGNKLISGTPIVLYENNYLNKYISFKRDSADFDFFFKRLKDNSIKKYNAYTGNDYNFKSDIFDSFEFNREVSVQMKIRENSFIIIGTLWNELEKNISRDEKDFYNFLFDCGLGEKNSIGYGFINNRR